jgi:NTE family protein
MGALIGGLYACGKLQEYKEWVLGLDMFDVAKLLDFSLVGSGMIQGEKVFKKMQEMIGKVNIEDLPIKYTAVATDLIKQKEVWIQEGDLLDAIRASIAIPTIFTPKKMDNRLLIDGGVLNPLPIAPTIADNTELTIAVNLNATNTKKYTITIPKKELEKENKLKEIFFELKQKTQSFFEKELKESYDNMSMFTIIGKTIDIMQNSVLECKMAGYSPDIMINIPNDACDFYEFNRAYEMIELGRMITQDDLKKQI